MTYVFSESPGKVAGVAYGPATCVVGEVGLVGEDPDLTGGGVWMLAV